MLVPEIALTPQTVGRFQARFGDTVALLHSALGEGERYDEWRRLRSGEARIAVGPRSAVFAPVARPRAGGRRRGARRLLQARGRPALRRPRAWRPSARGAAGAALLVGSATPRPETWHALPRLHAARARRRRARCRPCEVLDMRGAGHPLHPETRRALGEARKAIVLLNRRGWSNFLTCRTLREGLGVPAVRRRARAAPRASARSPATTAATASAVPQRCDACGSLAVARHGAGTERARARAGRGARRAGVPARRRHGGRQGRRARSCSRASTPRRPGCCSARRWWPRATTSPTSRSASCSTPTRPCASPTSAPRSGRSR